MDIVLVKNTCIPHVFSWHIYHSESERQVHPGYLYYYITGICLLQIQALAQVLKVPIEVIQSEGPSLVSGEHFTGSPIVLT